jgi:PAS domain S-box-containing protein
MLSQLLQDRAALYVSGSMSAAEQENFELVLRFHDELRQWVAEAQQAGAALAMADIREAAVPSPVVKSRLLRSLAQSPRSPALDALVVTDGSGRIEWVNGAFTAMCGYTLDELWGKKPGAVLQGPATDASVVARLRTALRSTRPCRETLVNYHKDGSTYVVDVQISPVLDEGGSPLWFIAQEREVSELSAAGA